MNTGLVRFGLIALVILVPGGLVGALFWKLWSRRSRNTQALTTLDSLPSFALGERTRISSQIGVPRFVGPPYLYAENLKRQS